MSEQRHSPLPWRVEPHEDGYADIWADGVQVVDGRRMRGGELLEVNAARAIACVNALSGVRNPEAVGRFLKAAKKHCDLHNVGTAGGKCNCRFCTAFRELEMEKQ